MGGVASAGGEVDEEGLVGILRAHAVDPADRLFGHRVGQVEVLVLGDTDRRVVLGQEWIVLAGLAAEEPPEIVEAPGVGPQVERAGGPLLMVGRQVPLAETGRAVAIHLQHLRERRRGLGTGRAVSRERAGQLGTGAEAHRVVVAARDQGRARAGTERSHMKAVVPEAAVRQAGHVRCLDRATEGRWVAKAGIVDEHQQDVRCAAGRPHRSRYRPVGPRVFERAAPRAAEARISDGQPRAIDIVSHRRLLSFALGLATIGIVEPAAIGQRSFAGHGGHSEQRGWSPDVSPCSSPPACH